MSTIYLMVQGSSIRKAGERLVVRYEEEILLERHFRDISRIMIFGNIQLTTQAISTILERGIDCIFFSLSGYYKGKLITAKSKSSITKLAQITHWKNSDFMNSLATETVKLKILGQLAVINKRRSSIQQSNQLIRDIKNSLEKSIGKIEINTNLEQLRGIEGSATKNYFSGWDTLLPEGLLFEKRTRRPALNEVNSLLNFSYAILVNEVNSAVEARGFDPLLGFYHRLRHGRISLSLDVMEWYRPILVDQWVIRLLRERKLGKSDFELNNEYGFILSEDGRKKYFIELKKWQMKSKYRQIIDEGVQVLEDCYIKGDSNDFKQRIEKVLSHLL